MQYPCQSLSTTGNHLALANSMPIISLQFLYHISIDNVYTLLYNIYTPSFVLRFNSKPLQQNIGKHIKTLNRCVRMKIWDRESLCNIHARCGGTVYVYASYMPTNKVTTYYGTSIAIAKDIPYQVASFLQGEKLVQYKHMQSTCQLESWHGSCTSKIYAMYVGIRFAGGTWSADGTKRLL